MRPLRVFLCHASQDKPAVRKLHRYLKQRGVQPWLDELDLLPGENWEVEIPNALFASDVILVCLSKNSVDKEGYVQKEITFALDKAQEKPEGTIFIIPVKLEDCNVPRRLNRYQWVDLFRADGYKRLLLGLNKRALGLAPEVSPVLLAGESGPKLAPKAEIAPPDIKKLEAQKAEQAARERAEREAAEQAAREKAEREAAEKAAFEKAVREAQEKADRLASEREAARREEQAKSEREASRTPAPASPSPRGRGGRGEGKPAGKPAPKFPLRPLLVGGLIVLLLLLGSFGLNYLIKNMPVATATAFPLTKTLIAKLPTSTSTIPTSSPTETHLPVPTLGIGSTMISEKDGMVMVYIPAGEFQMGSESGNLDESPVYPIYTDAFWMDESEVTNAMYAKCVEAGKCGQPAGSHYSDPTYANYPVYNVSWNDAQTYCAWAGTRLPTEAEWEKAARGGLEGRRYPWGDDQPVCALGAENGAQLSGCYGDTIPVKSFTPNTYGLYDMAGNLWEWVNSIYQSYPYDASDGREDLSSSDARVLRGGSWGYSGYSLRVSYRIWGLPDLTGNGDIGFRCARSLP